MSTRIVYQPETQEDRLAKLPAKVARPLRELVDREHISCEALDVILDAGDLSGQPHKLLGFAVSFHHLKMSGVAVDDVINMAKSQRRRICLDWKPNRWKAEHDRLSRAETFQKLSAENVTYDLSQYDVHLPSRFPGYLIRSSRRLGAEGLRQRHCIASYHAQILSGYIAIAVVFVDQKRWTVQLGTNLDPDRPLRITQIKAAYNEAATPRVRDRVYDALQIEKPPSQSGAYDPLVPETRRERRFKENLRAVLPVLREHGVTTVHVEFDGSGDSGSIDRAVFLPERTEFDPARVTVELLEVNRYYDGNSSSWRSQVTRELVDLNTAMDRIVEEYTEHSNVDWHNNDGGFGHFTMDVANGTCEMEVHQRYTESTCEFSEELDLNDEEFDEDDDFPALQAPNAA